MKISNIKNWFEVAIPNPTIKQACIQVGVHFEECGEMARTLADFNAGEELERISEEYKRQNPHYCNVIQDLSDCDKTQLLDDLCDQIVTAIGVAHMLGMDIEGALSEVNASNHSKFEDGKAVFNEQGKITKGKHYRAPELDKFI